MGLEPGSPPRRSSVDRNTAILRPQSRVIDRAAPVKDLESRSTRRCRSRTGCPPPRGAGGEVIYEAQVGLLAHKELVLLAEWS
jgi:hypothetical protein